MSERIPEKKQLFEYFQKLFGSSEDIEKTVGLDGIEPIASYHAATKFHQNALGVVQIRTYFSSGNDVACTGFIISQRFILTAKHCLQPSDVNDIQTDRIESITARSLFHSSRSSIVERVFPLEVNAEEDDLDLDYAILKVKNSLPAEVKPIKLSKSPTPARQPLYILHHPQGEPLRVSREKCVSVRNELGEMRLIHKCDTRRGSSGAPIFDAETHGVIALHTSASKFRDDNRSVLISDIIRISKVMKGIKKSEARSRYSELVGKCMNNHVLLERRGRQLDCVKYRARFSDCQGCPSMVIVPAGVVLVGSPSEDGMREADEPIDKRLPIDKPFAIGSTEVTMRSWKLCVSAKRCEEKLNNGTDDELPVSNITWVEAVKFTRWLSDETGFRYRLPTELEWSYAARAERIPTTYSKYGYGLSDDKLCDFVNGSNVKLKCSSKNRDAFENVAPTGQLAANAFGLHDTLGNLWEWTLNCSNRSPHSVVDIRQINMEEKCDRSLRGGSFGQGRRGLRIANRWSRDYNVYRSPRIGFRVIREISP